MKNSAIDNQPKSGVPEPEYDPRCEAILDGNPSPMLIIDGDRRIRWANRAALRLTGTITEALLCQRAGEALRCLGHLNDHGGCGFGPGCEPCRLRAAIAATIQSGQSQPDVEANVNILGPMCAQQLNMLVSTMPVRFAGQRMALVYLEKSARPDADAGDSQRDKAFADSVIDSLPGVFYLFDSAGRFLRWNKNFERITGYAPPELARMSPWDFFRGDDCRRIREAVQTVFDSGETQVEADFVSKDGRATAYLFTGVRVQLAQGECMAGVGTDISERKRVEQAVKEASLAKQAEETLRAASHYNRSLIEASLDPLVTIDADGKVTDVNAATEKVTGRTRQELIGTDFSDYFTEPGKARAGYQRVFREGAVQNYALEIRRRDGHHTPVLYNASVYRDQAGKALGVFAAARDVTERNRAEAAQAQLAAIVESSDDAIKAKDLDGVILSWNQGATRIYGYTAEETVGKSISMLVPPGHPDEVPQALERIRRGESVRHYETVRLTKDGRAIHVSLTISPIKDAEGRVVGASTIARDITERRRAEEALQRAGAYNRRLIEASLDPLVTIDADGKITDVNAATERVTGHARRELIGTDFSDYFTEPDKARAGYQQVFREGAVQDYALDIRHRDGHRTPVLYNASVYRDEDGHVIGIFAAARDITGTRQAQEALRLASAYTRSLIEASLDPLVTINADGQITDVNAATEKVTGCTRQELVGTDFSEYFTEPDQARAGYQQVFREGSVQDYPLEIRHRDGHSTPVLYNATVYRDQGGNVIGVFAAARDITATKKAEDALRLASAYNRSLIEASLDPLVTIDEAGKITDVNAATEKATGRSRMELVGTDFSDYFTEPAKARQGYQQVFREGSVHDYPLEIRHRDGHHSPVLYNASVYRDGLGRVRGVFAAARDITELERAEEAVRTERQRLNDVFEILPAYVVLLSPDYRVPYANRFFRDRFGDSHGRKCYEFLFGRSRPCEVCETFAVFRDNRPRRWEWTGPDGRNYEILDYPFTDTDGSQFVLEMGIDITDRKRLEIELRRLNEELEQRVAARTAELAASNKELEAFAYSVSHDLRAPLRAIDGFSQAILEDCSDRLGEEGRSHLQRARAASQRMGELIDGLLSLSRTTRSEMRRTAVDLSVLAQTIAGELKRANPARRVEFAITPGLVVHADTNLMRIMLENLLDNAWKFTSKHARARISIGAVEHNGERICFVRDDGAGFDMTYADKLFGAFSRLHAMAEFEGTGIGLATVQRIIHRHGGRVWAEGEVEQGATIYFTIPYGSKEVTE